MIKLLRHLSANSGEKIIGTILAFYVISTLKNSKDDEEIFNSVGSTWNYYSGIRANSLWFKNWIELQF